MLRHQTDIGYFKVYNNINLTDIIHWNTVIG